MKDQGSDHEHQSAIKTPKQLIVVIVLSFVIPIVGIILLTRFVTTGNEPSQDVLNPESVAARIKPVASVMTPDSPGAAEEAAASGLPTVAAAPAAAAGDKGQSTYQAACAACHASGVLGAPKTGDKGQWASRIGKGASTLYTHAIGGFNQMPPKGGNASLSDADVKAAVDYMVAQSK